jgi:hypothetical protein
MIEKIKALLNLAGNNPSEAEAASAAAKAAELMQKYQIAQLHLEQHRPPKVEVRFERRYGNVAQQRDWARTLANVVALDNSCLCVYTPGTTRVTFYGRPEALEVVEYVYAYLERAILRACDDHWYRMPDHHRRGYRPLTWRNNFCTGATSAVAATLARERAVREATVDKGTSALVVREKQDLERFRGKVKAGDNRRNTYDHSGYGAGHAAGRKISVRPGLGGAGGGQKRLGEAS